MPELPEVETIVNDLRKVLPGLKIQDVWSDVFDAKKIKKEIVGRKILKIERRGKNILIRLSDSRTVLIHQKMTGHLLYGKWRVEGRKWISLIPGPLQDPENRFIHLLFFLSNDYQLALCDMRKFAKVAVLATEKISEELKNLGLDPFEKNFNLVRFSEIMKTRQGAIKKVLMDQSAIAGIGNIYSDEILWKADVHPLKEVQKLNGKNLKNIYQAIKTVLKKAIKARGDSVSDYRRPSGEKGRYQEMQNAYQMTGAKCKKRDKGIIKRIKIGGRSAHFCPVHQKM